MPNDQTFPEPRLSRSFLPECSTWNITPLQNWLAQNLRETSCPSWLMIHALALEIAPPTTILIRTNFPK